VTAPWILIVDDNPLNLKLARLILETEGYLVRTAIDAEEALRMLATDQPGLILMDLQLPGMDGLELTRRLKAGIAADVIIIAVTAYAMKTDEQKALAAGCDAYLRKPFDTTTLPDMVARYMPRSA
jgi:two-component system, cell cycle response regulator DivK